LNYLCTENPTLTLKYVSINLLSIKKLNPNLTNNFVVKFQFLVKSRYKQKNPKTVNQKVPKKQNWEKETHL